MTRGMQRKCVSFGAEGFGSFGGIVGAKNVMEKVYRKRCKGGGNCVENIEFRCNILSA